MASTMIKSYKLKRSETKKSHSWWWDSHVSPKNSKWLQENLEEMDQKVKIMVKLIEEDGDSFAKKAEMYYQKRPELIHLVEEFYRMYRSLAEKYDNVTGELRRNVPSDLQSQCSGISEASSEPPPVTEQHRPTRRRSGIRAAGFDFFLGASGGNNSEIGSREGDETSTLDSESESSDDSSIINYSAVKTNEDDQGLCKKILELENELRDVKEKLEISEGLKNDDKFEGYEDELRNTKEKLRLSEDEVNRLLTELTKIESTKVSDEVADESEIEFKIDSLEEDLKNTKEKLRESENKVAKLKMELKSSQEEIGLVKKESSSWKVKLNKEEREITKLHDRMTRYKSNLSDRDQEIRLLKESIADANKSLSEENSRLQEEITKLLKEKSYSENDLKEIDHRCQSLEEELRRVKEGKIEIEVELENLKITLMERNDEVTELNIILNEFGRKHEMLIREKEEVIVEGKLKEERIEEMKKHLHELHIEHVKLIQEIEIAGKVVKEERKRVEELEKEVEKQEEAILERAEEKREAIRQLCFSLEHYRDEYHQLREAVIGHHSKRFPVMAS